MFSTFMKGFTNMSSTDSGYRFKIAKENGATYELFSNTPIPDNVKKWLTKKECHLPRYYISR